MAGVSDLGNSQIKLKLHRCKSGDVRCLGKVSEWGVCMEVKNTIGDINGGNCPDSHRKKVSLPWIPSDDDEVLIVPENSRRGPAGVVNGCYRANDYSSEALEHFYDALLTPEEWVAELTNPENFKPPALIKEEKPVRPAPEVDLDLSEVFQIDKVTLREPTKYTSSDDDVDDVLDEHRALLEDASKKFALLADIVDALQRLVDFQGKVLNQNGETAKRCVSTILHRVGLLEGFLGDIEELPSDADSVMDVVKSVLKRLKIFRTEVLEEVGAVSQDLGSTQTKIVTTMAEMWCWFHSSSNAFWRFHFSRHSVHSVPSNVGRYCGFYSRTSLCRFSGVSWL